MLSGNCDKIARLNSDVTTTMNLVVVSSRVLHVLTYANNPCRFAKLYTICWNTIEQYCHFTNRVLSCQQCCYRVVERFWTLLFSEMRAVLPLWHHSPQSFTPGTSQAGTGRCYGNLWAFVYHQSRCLYIRCVSERGERRGEEGRGGEGWLNLHCNVVLFI